MGYMKNVGWKVTCATEGGGGGGGLSISMVKMILRGMLDFVMDFCFK